MNIYFVANIFLQLQYLKHFASKNGTQILATRLKDSKSKKKNVSKPTDFEQKTTSS